MKAALFAIAMLVCVDAAMNHSRGLHGFLAGVAGFGAAIGSWVYYTG